MQPYDVKTNHQSCFHRSILQNAYRKKGGWKVYSLAEFSYHRCKTLKEKPTYPGKEERIGSEGPGGPLFGHLTSLLPPQTKSKIPSICECM